MEIFTIAFSTFLGAAVALIAERLTRLYDSRAAEEAALNNLILDLAAKRAFLASGNWTWTAGEVQRVVESIKHARSLVRETRMKLTPRSSALPHLREMNRACNTFLEASEREDDEALKSALQRLTQDMSEQVAQLHSRRPKRIYADRPGSYSIGTSS